MDQHNLPAIRRFIVEFFDDSELRVFAADYFRDVYNDFTTGMRKSRMVELLVEYCFRYGRIPDLLAALKRERERPFANAFPNFALDKAARSPDRTRNNHQIFISHAHQDAALAHRLAQDLVRAGWQVWIAPQSLNPGEKWVEAIGRGLEESGIFLLLITPAAVKSRWVQSEANIAIELDHQQKLRFIPVKVKAADDPVFWRSYQQILFTNQYETDLQTLLNHLGENVRDAVDDVDEQQPAIWERVKTVVSGLSAVQIAYWQRVRMAFASLPIVRFASLFGIIGLGAIVWLILVNLPEPDTGNEGIPETTREIAEVTLQPVETADSAIPSGSVIWAGPDELLEIDRFQGEIALDEAVTGTFQGSESDTWLFTTGESVTVDVRLEGSAVESGYVRFFSETDFISTPTKEGQASEVGGTTRLSNISLEPGRYMIAVQDALGNGRYTLTVQKSEIETAAGTPSPETTPLVAEQGEEVNGLNLIGYCKENPDHCLAEGNTEAIVTVVEVTDYRCSFCRAFNLETAGRLKEEYVASGRVYWLILPTAVLDPERELFSNAAAVASLCLNDEFPEYASAIHRDLLNWQVLEGNGNDDLFPNVEAKGVDPNEAFADCYENEIYWQFALENSDVVTAQGVTSVPYFAINDRTLVGDVPFETFKSQIDRAIIDTINR